MQDEEFLAEADAQVKEEGDGGGAGSGEGAGAAEQAPKKVEPSQRVTTRFMTKYEKARILGTRALQLRCVLPARHFLFRRL